MARRTVVRRKDIAVAVGLGVAIAAGTASATLFAIRPALAASEAARKRLVDIRRQVSSMKDKRRQLDELQAKTGALRADLEAFAARVPSSEDCPLLLTEVVRLGGAEGLRLVDTQNSAATSLGRGLQRVGYRLTLLGSYHALGRFHSRIESHKTYFRIPGATIQTNEDGAVRATLRLVFYARDRDGTASSDPPPREKSRADAVAPSTPTN
jgi:Tfp pilus assembly protein PilO